jgi:hypothetical protein
MNDIERANVISTLAQSLVQASGVKDISPYQVDEIVKAMQRVAKTIGTDSASAIPPLE